MNIPPSTARSTTPPPAETSQPVAPTGQPTVVPGSEGAAPTAPILTSFVVYVGVAPALLPTPDPSSEQLRQLFSDLNIRERATRGLARLAAMEGNPATTGDISFNTLASTDQKASPK